MWLGFHLKPEGCDGIADVRIRGIALDNGLTCGKVYRDRTYSGDIAQGFLHRRTAMVAVHTTYYIYTHARGRYMAFAFTTTAMTMAMAAWAQARKYEGVNKQEGKDNGA